MGHLRGVDAPRLNTRGGAARRWVLSFLGGKEAECRQSSVISLDRQSGDCYTEGKDNGRAVVKAGFVSDCRR